MKDTAVDKAARKVTEKVDSRKTRKDVVNDVKEITEMVKKATKKKGGATNRSNY
jgi:hypothetical protein